MKTLRAATVAVVLLVTACALSGCGGGSPTVPAAPTGDSTLVLGISELSGKPSASGTRALPAVALFGDHRLIVPAGRSGALQQATAYQLTDERFSTVYGQAYAAGLATPHEYDDSSVVDGRTLVFTLATPNGAATTRVAVPEGDGDGATGALVRLRAGLTPATWPASAFSAPPRPYEPARLAVLATIAETGAPADREWPFEPPARMAGGYCATIDTARVPQVVSLATAATTQTRWSSGGQVYQLDFRPLLPNEAGCQP
jgi:hypothetical protein